MEVMICGSEKWGCRPEMEKQWTGEMRVDRRKMRSEWETCSENSPWALTESELGSKWIGADQSGSECGSEFARSGSERIGVWVGIRLEWIGAWLVSGSELGSSGSEWCSSTASGLDRERIGVDRRDFRRVRRAWIVTGPFSGSELGCVESWADWSLTEQCVCESLCVRERGGKQLKWK